ncbi:RHS repeat-associated core domain-containing protein [Luteimonas sp. SDU82]|uniref:RHS repeat-associated core domain-containing protein n=1 Tax=Luteimonas sp. SDU82 TaxID=3422592 RepID=UPI003EB8634E
MRVDAILLCISVMLVSIPTSAQNQLVSDGKYYAAAADDITFGPLPSIADAIAAADARWPEMQAEWANGPWHPDRNCRPAVRTVEYLPLDGQFDYGPTAHLARVIYRSPDVRQDYCYGANFYIWTGLTYENTLENLGEPECLASCGNPINIPVRSKYQREDDIQGKPAFSRFYNSHANARSSSIGVNWSHSYGDKIEVISHGVSAPAYVLLSREDGGGSYFRKINGVWSNPARKGDVLEDILEPDGAHAGWRFRAFNSRKSKIFDAAGRLTQVRNDLTEEVLSISYAGGTPGDTGFDRISSVIAGDGRGIFFSYNSGGYIEGISDGNSEILVYAQDSFGRLTHVLFPAGTGKIYHYNEPPHDSAPTLSTNLTGITDENGDRSSTYKYVNDVPVETVRGTSEAWSVSDSGDDSWNITTPLGATETRRFSKFNGIYRLNLLVTHCSDCVSDFNQYTYDSDGNVRQQIRNDFYTIYTYNARGLEQRRRENDVNFGDVRITETDWHSTFDLPLQVRILDSVGTVVKTTDWTYNSRGQYLSQLVADPVAGVSRLVTTTYCEQAQVDLGLCPQVGLITSVDGPRSDVVDRTTYVYRMTDAISCGTSQATCEYRKGDLWKVTNALGQVTETLRYDGAGRPLSVKDANGVITDYEYHPRGWLTATKVRGPADGIETDDRITRVEYWPTGLVKKVTQPDGAFTTYAYDLAQRLTGITDNAGNTITYTLDNAGNRIAEETRDANDTLRRTLSRLYNQLGQLSTQADADDNPTDFTYDPNGNVKTVTDPLGRATSNDYDPLNRLIRTLQDTGGIEAETTFEYDALDHLTKVTDPKGLETSYTYNAFGDLLQLDSPDTGPTTHTYDSAGNRTGQVDARGQASSYAYDALKRLTGIGYDGAADQNVTYVYDTVQPDCATGETFAIGRLSAMAYASGSTRYCYDRFGQMVRKVQATNGQTFTLLYVYTKSGQLSSLTYPDGSAADYVRDAQGRVTEVGVTSPGGRREVVLTNASYAPFGPATGWAYGNGRTLSRAHDLDYRPQSILDSATGGLDLGYSYDPAGNLTALRTADLAEPSRATFDYDALNRLTAFRDGAAGVAIESYDYDATGNRTGFTNAGGTQAYVYPTDSHRLASVGGVPRTYDAAGNTATVGIAREFIYNAANRLSQVRQGGTITMHYAYSGKGERVRRYLGTDDVTTLYDEAGRWLGDYDGAGIPLQQAIWLDDNPVGLLVGATGVNRLHYVQPDHLGTPRAVIDPIRNVAVWNWDLASEVFGNGPPNQDPDGDGTSFRLDMRFPGQRYDLASDLNYNYFRDYEPATGRYAQSDPIGLDGGISTFAYVKLNPIARRDPLGLLDDSPGEYCDPIRGMMCGPSLYDKNYGCGEECKSYCRLKYTNMIEDAAGNYLDDDSCSVLGHDTSPREGLCEQMQATNYFIYLQHLRRAMRQCLGACKPCDNCE